MTMTLGDIKAKVIEQQGAITDLTNKQAETLQVLDAFIVKFKECEAAMDPNADHSAEIMEILDSMGTIVTAANALTQNEQDAKDKMNAATSA